MFFNLQNNLKLNGHNQRVHYFFSKYLLTCLYVCERLYTFIHLQTPMCVPVHTHMDERSLGAGAKDICKMSDLVHGYLVLKSCPHD